VQTFVALAFACFVSMLSAPSGARPWPRPHPPRLLEPAAFDRLLSDVRSEPFTDGKLERVRAVAGGRVYVFTGGQVVALLESFTFWADRLQALRLLPNVDTDNAELVRRYFESAPTLIYTEAGRVLGLAR
jgi:hypothetical protein